MCVLAGLQAGKGIRQVCIGSLIRQLVLNTYHCITWLSQILYFIGSWVPVRSTLAYKTLCTRWNKNFWPKFDESRLEYPLEVSRKMIMFWPIWTNFQGHQKSKGHDLKSFLCTQYSQKCERLPSTCLMLARYHRNHCPSFNHILGEHFA